MQVAPRILPPPFSSFSDLKCLWRWLKAIVAATCGHLHLLQVKPPPLPPSLPPPLPPLLHHLLLILLILLRFPLCWTISLNWGWSLFCQFHSWFQLDSSIGVDCVVLIKPGFVFGWFSGRSPPERKKKLRFNLWGFSPLSLSFPFTCWQRGGLRGGGGREWRRKALRGEGGREGEAPSAILFRRDAISLKKLLNLKSILVWLIGEWTGWRLIRWWGKASRAPSAKLRETGGSHPVGLVNGDDWRGQFATEPMIDADGSSLSCLSICLLSLIDS